MEQEKCVADVRGESFYRSYPCGKKAKVQDPSGWHCGIHSDATVAKRRQKQDDRWAKERAVGNLRREREQTKRQALEKILETVMDPTLSLTEDMRHNAAVLRKGYGKFAGED